jgi:hypothetical protein
MKSTLASSIFLHVRRRAVAAPINPAFAILARREEIRISDKAKGLIEMSRLFIG